jgi:hypothetical protein
MLLHSLLDLVAFDAAPLAIEKNARFSGTGIDRDGLPREAPG